ncbi:hypothetical protein [Xanthobacter sp. 126]|uniref:hypothetical protein n=1 Tax=Xanthobacter sp. 126 TaxID=1131814 RepID=UPI001FDA1DD2|nr:hypothetical protein [Xanthobacter sp. 126]
MSPRNIALVLALVGGVGYLGLSYLFFEMPQTVSAAEDCGFLPEEFVGAGQLTYERRQAWWVSFQRKEEAYVALSVAAALAFVGFALGTGPRNSAGATTGAALGGGVLAVSALCVSCLAPVLSVVGLGVAGSLLAGVPKWLILINTLLLTGWGTLALSRRRHTACPLPARRGASLESR